MQHKKHPISWALLAIVSARSVAATAIDTPVGAPVVAELFTSQGCNSCPPAEALLGELAGRSDVLPLAFHVTYWNDLGWRDRFSIQEADARQYRYASAIGRRGVYTPQLILNGSSSVLGSNRKDVLSAITSAARPAAIRLSASSGAVRIELPSLEGGCDCDLLLLGVLPSTQTAVGRGENAGRLLRESNVVRQLYPQPGWDGMASSRVARVPQLPAEASLLVVLAQRRADARIVAVGATNAATIAPKQE
jgi:hypothetical protein